MAAQTRVRTLIRQHGLFLSIATLTLFASFSINFFGAMPTAAFIQNFKDSEALVVNQVRCEGGPYTNQMLELKEITTSNTQDVCNPDELKPYSSQYGLQGKVYTLGYKAISVASNMSVNAYIALAQLLTAFASALSFGLLALWVRRRYGLFAASSFTFLIAVSPMLVGFARNLYWALPLLVAPFIYTLYLYKPDANRRQRLLFWSVLGLFFYVRYLSGYEYITTITIMVAAAALFHLYMAKRGWRTCVKETAMVLAVSVIAFSAALVTHIASLRTPAGSTSEAIAIIKKRATERTTNSEDYLVYPFMGLQTNLNDQYAITNSYLDLDGRAKSPSQAEASAVSLINYASMPVVNLPITLNQPFATYIQSLATLVVILVALYKTRRRWVSSADSRSVDALFVGSAVSFIGYLSWLVLARSHALVHAHINGILVYTPFALFGYIIISLYLRTWVVKAWKKIR